MLILFSNPIIKFHWSDFTTLFVQFNIVKISCIYFLKQSYLIRISHCSNWYFWSIWIYCFPPDLMLFSSKKVVLYGSKIWNHFVLNPSSKKAWKHSRHLLKSESFGILICLLVVIDYNFERCGFSYIPIKWIFRISLNLFWFIWHG